MDVPTDTRLNTISTESPEMLMRNKVRVISNSRYRLELALPCRLRRAKQTYDQHGQFTNHFHQGMGCIQAKQPDVAYVGTGQARPIAHNRRRLE